MHSGIGLSKCNYNGDNDNDNDVKDQTLLPPLALLLSPTQCHDLKLSHLHHYYDVDLHDDDYIENFNDDDYK